MERRRCGGRSRGNDRTPGRKAVVEVAALYLARGFFVPVLIGILASYALHPLVDWLAVCRVPRAIGAALVLAVVIASFSWIGVSMSDDAQAVIENCPRPPASCARI